MKNAFRVLALIPATLVLAASARAQTNDERIRDYILNVCGAPPPDLVVACQNAQGAPGSQIGNAGTIGASGANYSVGYLKRRAAKRDKEVEKEEEKKETGGGASADARSGRFSVFANLSRLDGARDTTALENGFDTSQTGLVTGFDYRFNKQLFAGTALCYGRTENQLNGGVGNVDSGNITLTGFGNYIVRDDIIIDGYLSLGRLSYDSTRQVTFGSINEDANASYDGRQLALGATGGFSHYVNSWTVTGTVKMDYISTGIDAYSETGGGGLNFQFEEQTIESLTAKLGAQAAYAWSQSWGVIIPQGRLYYVHEFSNDSRSVESALVLAPQSAPLSLPTDEPDRDYFLGGIGASAVLPAGMQTFVDVEFLSGHSYLSTWTATLGLRWEI